MALINGLTKYETTILDVLSGNLRRLNMGFLININCMVHTLGKTISFKHYDKRGFCIFAWSQDLEAGQLHNRYTVTQFNMFRADCLIPLILALQIKAQNQYNFREKP